MSQPEFKQRLLSILAADVVGYTRLMGSDEKSTVAALEKSRLVFRAEIERHHGSVIDMTGDSVLAAFGSATGAVTAATAIQTALHRAQSTVPDDHRMLFRIGVHLGDVFEKSDGTIYGEGVNIAARLESLAEPGGIALSEAVARAVRGKVPQAIHHLGTRRVKNVQEPLSLYALELPWQARSGWHVPRSRWVRRWVILCGTAALIAAVAMGVRRIHVGGELGVMRGASTTAPGGPSIAVLPFVDLSEGKDQSYFSDGLSEEVIDRLAQVAQLRVIARTSSFVFKDSHASIPDIARQLNVDTLLEGSVRRSVDRIRVSAQLVRASDSASLWSGTYEKKLTDVFEVQDQIANAVVAALKVKLDRTAPEPNRYIPKPDAYDQYLLGRQLMRTRQDNYEQRAVDAFARAVALDPSYGAARAAHAFALSFVAENEPNPQLRDPLMERALAAAEQAVAVGAAEPDAYATRGLLRFAVRWDVAGADADLSKSLQLDPAAEPTLAKYAYFLMATGRADEALSLTKRIKEIDPFFASPWETEARIEAARGAYAVAEGALRHAHTILQIDPDSGELLPVIALMKGESDRAQKLFAKLGNRAHRDWGACLVELQRDHPDAARRALQVFVDESPFEYYRLAVLHARAARKDEAFAALQRAFETRDTELQLILVDPLLSGLHADPRFDRLLAQLGLPAKAVIRLDSSAPFGR